MTKIEKNELRIKRDLLIFLIVGAVSTSVDFLIYFAMVSFELDYAFSKAVSFILGTLVGYIGNSRVTFRRRSRNVSKYFIVYFISLIVNVGINNLVYSTSAEAPLSWVLATFSSTSINFIGLRYFAFSRQV